MNKFNIDGDFDNFNHSCSSRDYPLNKLFLKLIRNLICQMAFNGRFRFVIDSEFNLQNCRWTYLSDSDLFIELRVQSAADQFSVPIEMLGHAFWVITCVSGIE